MSTKIKRKRKGGLEWIQERLGKGRGEIRNRNDSWDIYCQGEQKNGPVAGGGRKSRGNFCYSLLKPEVLLWVLFDPGEREVRQMREKGEGVGKASYGWAMQIPLWEVFD